VSENKQPVVWLYAVSKSETRTQTTSAPKKAPSIWLPTAGLWASVPESVDMAKHTTLHHTWSVYLTHSHSSSIAPCIDTQTCCIFSSFPPARCVIPLKTATHSFPHLRPVRMAWLLVVARRIVDAVRSTSHSML